MPDWLEQRSQSARGKHKMTRVSTPVPVKNRSVS